jgi:hypothetical protein
MSIQNLIEKEIRDVWFGRQKLAKVFWIYKFLIGTILNIIIELAIINFKTLSFTWIIFSIYLIYHIWILKGLIACKNNVIKFYIFSKFIPYLVALNVIGIVATMVELVTKTL